MVVDLKKFRESRALSANTKPSSKSSSSSKDLKQAAIRKSLERAKQRSW